jgi:hypothetical protein
MHTETTASRRSVFRLRNLILAVVAGVLVGLLVMVMRFVNQEPGRPGKFTAEINQLVADAQADTAGQPNGWPLVLEAVEIHERVTRLFAERPMPDGVPESFEFPLTPETVADPGANDAVRQEVGLMIEAFDREGLFEKLDEVTASQHFLREMPDGKLLYADYPELGPIRGLARLCRARMFLAGEAKDGPAFVRAAKHGLSLGNAAAKQPSAIDRIIGAAIDALVCRSINAAIRDHGLDETTCRALLDLLHGRRGYDAVLGLKVEHLFAKDTVEWSHSDDGNGDGRIMHSQMQTDPRKSGTFRSLVMNLSGAMEPTKRETLDAFENLYSVAIDQASKGLRERDPAASQNALDAYPRRYRSVHILMPSVDRFITLSSEHDLQLAGTRALLAVELHKHAKVSYPARLEDLEPALRDVVTAQPWGPEMRYKRLPDGEDPDRRAYLLYWIGLDGTDDGGRVDSQEGSQGAWRPKNKGVDFVFNEPKEKPKTEGGSGEGGK